MMVFDGELELGEGDGTGARISKQSIPPKSKKKKKNIIRIEIRRNKCKENERDKYGRTFGETENGVNSEAYWRALRLRIPS
jgi:hypothetical protein